MEILTEIYNLLIAIVPNRRLNKIGNYLQITILPNTMEILTNVRRARLHSIGEAEVLNRRLNVDKLSIANTPAILKHMG